MFYKAKTLLAAAACLLAAAVSARAAAPAPSINATSTGSVNVSWTGGTSDFIAVLSTSPSFSVYTASGAVTASATSYPFLNPNTTYYFKVKSSVDADSLYSPVVSTATWVAAPGGIYSISSYFTAESSFTAGASIGWNTSSNPEWTLYDLQYSTNAAFTFSSTSLNGYPPIIVGGLNANTTYYFKVRARGISGTLTAYTSPISTATLAIKLSGLSDAVYETSTTVSWTAVNDATIQALQSKGYNLNLYSNPSLTSLVTPWNTTSAAASSATLTSLHINTTYYYRAGALNLPGTPNLATPRSFTTLAAVPQGLSRISVADYRATLGWTALAPGAALGYRLEASTSNFTAGTIPQSSTSYRADLSTLTITTLDPNTTYYFRVASINTAYSANYGAAQSSVTLALPVTADLADVSATVREVTVSFTPFQDFWQAFACEGYRLEGSTSPFGPGEAVVSSVTYTYQNQLRTLTLGNLAANTAYYLRLGTLNWEHTPNYTVLPSTKTGFPAPPAGVTLDAWNSSSSAGISFTPDPYADAHVAEASVYRFFDVIYKSSATPGASVSNLIISGLDSNTTYYFREGALYNGTTIYTRTVPEFRQTLPLPLTAPNFPGVFQSSVTVAWTPLANSGQSSSAESYLLEASTSPSFTSPVLFSSNTTNASLDRLTIAGLQPNTSYYFRAGTLNHEGSVNYVFTPATATLANQPVQTDYTGITPLTMTLNWLANSNPGDTLYLVRISSNSDYSAPVYSSATKNNYATFSSLQPNTTYYPELTPYNRLNRTSPALTFSTMSTGAYDPELQAYSGLGVSSVTVNWADSIPPFNPPGTQYRAQVSSSPDFSGTVLSSVTTGFTAYFGGLVSNASYYLQVSALNLSGVPAEPVSMGTALTLPATAYILPAQQTFSNLMTDGFSVTWAPNGNSSFTVYNVQASTHPDFSEINSSLSVRAETCTFSNLLIDAEYWVRVQARGQSGLLSTYESAGSTRTVISTRMNAVAGQDTIVSLETSYGRISIQLPPGSIGSSTVLTLKPSTTTFAAPNSAVSRLTPTGIGLIITHSPPTLVLKPLTITMPYRPADLPLNTVRANLVLALFDETNAIWVPLPSVSDTANDRVIAQTWHLSTFQIMQASPEAGLSDVKVYPNPYRPNSVSDVMHFTNMPPYAKVRIYTFLGELVREIKADVNGMAHWDGLNSDGRKTASGVYIAFIQSKDKKSSKSLKVAVER